MNSEILRKHTAQTAIVLFILIPILTRYPKGLYHVPVFSAKEMNS